MLLYGAILLTLVSASPVEAIRNTAWEWNNDTPGCALQHQLANGRTLGIGRTPGNDTTSISITSSRSFVPPSPAAKFKSLKNTKLALAPGMRLAAEISTITDRNGRFDVHGNMDDPGVLEALAAGTFVEFVAGETSIDRAPLSSGRAVVEALRECEDRLMRNWGVDPVAWRKLKTRPAPSNSKLRWISPQDYPQRAVRTRTAGITIARLNISATGKVVDCAAINPDPQMGFGVAVCQAVKKRAKFRAATDADGKNVPAPYVVIMRFVIQ
jgi:hypothetical protein